MDWIGQLHCIFKLNLKLIKNTKQIFLKYVMSLQYLLYISAGCGIAHTISVTAQ